MPTERFYTYILQCADDTLYTGWTTDVEKRLAAHNAGKGAKYTTGRLPVKIVAQWVFESKQAAMQAEYWIKKLPRAAKDQLILMPRQIEQVLP
ncbi:MAG: GIY-YIG nuclease family protein [Vampirovibrio sp.]|nr:GIY-YIG nuclease family protein [Vampirovibrio sp.]